MTAAQAQIDRFSFAIFSVSNTEEEILHDGCIAADPDRGGHKKNVMHGFSHLSINILFIHSVVLTVTYIDS